jgi:hypothetical protein
MLKDRTSARQVYLRQEPCHLRCDGPVAYFAKQLTSANLLDGLTDTQRSTARAIRTLVPPPETDSTGGRDG